MSLQAGDMKSSCDEMMRCWVLGAVPARAVLSKAHRCWSPPQTCSQSDGSYGSSGPRASAYLEYRENDESVQERSGGKRHGILGE